MKSSSKSKKTKKKKPLKKSSTPKKLQSNKIASPSEKQNALSEPKKEPIIIPKWEMLPTLQDYLDLCEKIKEMNEKEQKAFNRYLALNDLFYLLCIILKRPDAFNQWILERCREVQSNPDGHLDLWARFHYKSTIITFAATIQTILSNPETTCLIISHRSEDATASLKQIKDEFANNKLLITLFPDILYQEPEKQAQQWNTDGIIIKRQSRRKECTLESCSILSLPVGKHFDLLVYDDMVTQDSVTSPEMIKKTTEQWELSGFLGSLSGTKTRYSATRYHFSDTYQEIMDRGAAKPRIHPATIDGTPFGEPVLMTKEHLEQMRKEKGSFTFSCQFLQNPISGDKNCFNIDDLMFYRGTKEYIIKISKQMNVYIWVDSARAKKSVNSRKTSDYTVMVVIGTNYDGNYYLLDMARDRLNLSERWQKLWELHKLWKPKEVGYEANSAEADIDYIKEQQQIFNYRFGISDEYSAMNKQDKIVNTLQPIFESQRFYMPQFLMKDNVEGKRFDLIADFIKEEYSFYPSSKYDDMLDAIASCIRYLQPVFPMEKKENGGILQKKEEYCRNYDSITGEPL